MSPRRRGLDGLEEDYEDGIVAAATLAGWLVHCERRSRTKDGWKTAIKGHAGFPDLVLAHEKRRQALFVELKRPPNRPSPMQDRWIATLQACALDARVLYVPRQYEELLQIIGGRV